MQLNGGEGLVSLGCLLQAQSRGAPTPYISGGR